MKEKIEREAIGFGVYMLDITVLGTVAYFGVLTTKCIWNQLNDRGI